MALGPTMVASHPGVAVSIASSTTVRDLTGLGTENLTKISVPGLTSGQNFSQLPHAEIIPPRKFGIVARLFASSFALKPFLMNSFGSFTKLCFIIPRV